MIAVRFRAHKLEGTVPRWRSALWIWPWMLGLVLLGYLGNYGTGAILLLPEDGDAVIVAVFAIVVYQIVIRTAQPIAEIEPAVEGDLADGADLREVVGIA